MVRRIALIGTASSGALAPYDDMTWEIWGVSARGLYVTRANRWFELHRLNGEPLDWANNWRAAMRAFTGDIAEVLMLYPEPDLAPNVIQYPHKKICERFETYFMTSTFAWMMALAIDEMAPLGRMAAPGNEIGIWGVDMEYGTEYRQQRVGFRHFIGLARQLGIKVSRLASSGLAYEPVPYPLWQDDPLSAKIELRNKNTRGYIETFDKSLRLTRSLIAGTKTTLEEIGRFAMPGYDIAARRKSLEKELVGLMQTSAKLSEDIVHWSAVDGEQKYWRDYLNP